MPVLVVSHTRRKKRGAKTRPRRRHVPARIRRTVEQNDWKAASGSRYVDEVHQRVEVSVEEGSGSAQFMLAGLNWTLTVYRHDHTEKEVVHQYHGGLGFGGFGGFGGVPAAEVREVTKNYFAVRLEPALDNEGRDFDVRVTGALRIPCHRDKLHRVGAVGSRGRYAFAHHGPEPATKTFAAILRPSKRCHIVPDMLLAEEVTRRNSQLVGRSGKFVLEADLRVHSLFVGQFPTLRFGGIRQLDEKPWQQLIRVEKRRSDDGGVTAEGGDQSATASASAYTTFYVTRELLAFHSAHFKKLFASGSPRAATVTTLTKETISAKAFRSLLEILHCANVSVKACHVEQLLRFAHEYALPVVTAHLEKFLLSRKSFLLHSAKKLELADRYGLVTLKSQLVKRLGVKEDVGKVLDKAGKGRVKYEEGLTQQLNRRQEQLPSGEQMKREWMAVRDKRLLRKKAKASAKKATKSAA